jgi:hypothetical protein
MDCDLTKTVIDVSGVAIALFGGARALVAYRKKVTQERFQMLMKMQESFQSSKRFQQIREKLAGQGGFDGISIAERADYATFFENIALLCRGKLLRPEMAFYMFGFEALRCWNNETFWEGMQRLDKWWGVFREFAAELELLRETVQPDQIRL